MQPDEHQIKALKDAGKLLKFAAENRQLSEEVVSAIASSWEAYAEDAWTPDVSSKFWGAYNSLCRTVEPTSLDTMSCNEPTLEPRFWQFWQRRPISVARTNAQRFAALLVVLLLAVIVLQFAVTRSAGQIAEVDKLKEQMAKMVAVLQEQMAPIRVALGTEGFQDAKTTTEQKITIKKVQDGLRTLGLMQDLGATKIRQINILTSLKFQLPWGRGDFGQIQSVPDFDRQISRYSDNVRFFSDEEERASLIINVINASVLPLLLGMLGASAYVTRLISEQIRETTFSTTSSIRHNVRVVLGALAGVIVGFGWIGSGISYSPLALAFIAGYAVEPVFATVDGIARSFAARDGADYWGGTGCEASGAGFRNSKQ